MGGFGAPKLFGEGGIQIWCALLWFLGVWPWFVSVGCTWLSLVHVLWGRIWSHWLRGCAEREVAGRAVTAPDGFGGGRWKSRSCSRGVVDSGLQLWI